MFRSVATAKMTLEMELIGQAGSTSGRGRHMRQDMVVATVRECLEEPYELQTTYALRYWAMEEVI